MNTSYPLSFCLTPFVLAFLFAVQTPVRSADTTEGRSDETSATNGVKLLSAKRIWNEANHNAFTTLVRFKGKWYCAFREARGHAVLDGPGKIQVLASTDGEYWESASKVDDRAFDLRDPHLSVTPRNELMLVAGRAVSVNGRNKFYTAAQFSKDGAVWSEPASIGDRDFWLWSATWHKGQCYSIGYNTATNNQARLYRSADGRIFETLVNDLGVKAYPNESSIVFDSRDRAYCLLRASGPAFFGTADPPYTKWNWVNTGVPVGGPALIQIPDGRWFAAGRLYNKGQGSKTALWKVDPKVGRLSLALVFESGGDTSYPGLAWDQGVLWISYYSSHEQKTGIYLAKVAIPAAQP